MREKIIETTQEWEDLRSKFLDCFYSLQAEAKSHIRANESCSEISVDEVKVWIEDAESKVDYIFLMLYKDACYLMNNELLANMMEKADKEQKD